MTEQRTKTVNKIRLPIQPITNPHNHANYWDSKGYVKTKNYNHYTDEDKAKAIVMSHLIGQLPASWAMSIPLSTIHDWHHGRNVNERILTMARDFANEIKQGFEDALDKAIPELIKKTGSATYKDLSIAIGILVDKHQLLSNLPTSIVSDASMSQEDRAKAIAELMDRAAKRDSGADGDAK